MDNTEELTPEAIKDKKIQELREAVITAVDAGKNEEEISNAFGMSLRDAREFSIKRHYDKGRGSIQDFARIYRLEVSEVNEILEQPEMNTINFIGDLIDQEYAGQMPVNEAGETYKIPYDIK